METRWSALYIECNLKSTDLRIETYEYVWSTHA